MPRVTHFEVHADNPERAAAFYAKAFDWQISKWEGPQDYWLVGTGTDAEAGIDGGLMKRSNGEHTVVTINVPSFDEYRARIEAAGGRIVTPKMAVPGVGYMAYCVDTEGNTFGIMQTDPGAK